MYKAIRKFGIVIGIVLFLFGVAGCGPAVTPAVELEFSGERAMELVEEQVGFGPRHPGSPGHRQIQSWLQQQLQAGGWLVKNQEFVYRETELRNIIASNSYEGAPFFILGAHYDTRPVADEEIGLSPGPVLGANDGASGVAVLMELARVLPVEDMRCQLWLAFFDAEDSGGIDGWDWIVGSSYFADNLTSVPDGVVIVDMVGDADLNLPRERNSSDDLQQEIWNVGQSLGYQAFEDRLGYSILDDHTPFLRNGIPAVDIIDFDYAYWHTEEDTLDKIAPASLMAVGDTLAQWLEVKCSAEGAGL